MSDISKLKELIIELNRRRMVEIDNIKKILQISEKIDKVNNMPIKTENNIMTRYLLRDGNFGYYFYDKHDSIDLTLQMVIDTLNNLNDYNLRLLRENNKYKTYLIDNNLMKYISN